MKSVPDLSALHPFYVALAQVLVDNDQLKQKLGRISGVVKVINKIKSEQIGKITRLKSIMMIKAARKQAFGRLKSVIDQLEDDFEYLRVSRKKLKTLPVIFMDIPAVVVAGYPNVGKSSIINNICNSKIEVAQYPFTTKEIKVGQYKEGYHHIQFVDTPGVLDRPMARRNKIELQAITAMEHIARIIMFVIDPTINCGFQLEDQVSLLKEIQDSFQRASIMIVLNKLDIMQQEERDAIMNALNDIGTFDVIAYSAFTRLHEDHLIDAIKRKLTPPQD